mgnify:CR=1 FL=1
MSAEPLVETFPVGPPQCNCTSLADQPTRGAAARYHDPLRGVLRRGRGGAAGSGPHVGLPVRQGMPAPGRTSESDKSPD